jgi:hypothetical protein
MDAPCFVTCSNQPTAGFARVKDGTHVQFKSALRKTYITTD